MGTIRAGVNVGLRATVSGVEDDRTIVAYRYYRHLLAVGYLMITKRKMDIHGDYYPT